MLPLAEKFDVETNSTHEEVDVSKSLASHVRRKSLAICHRFHDTIPVKVLALLPEGIYAHM